MKILVVDDSEMWREIMRKELAKGGYDICEAKDGIMALAVAAEAKPDLITMDMNMPKMDGFLSFEKLKDDAYKRFFTHKSNHRIPLVFVTADDTLEQRAKGFAMGAADFITKPFEHGELLAVVNNILKPDKRFTGLTALVVDDSETALRIASDILVREGLNVIECENGKQALDVLKIQRTKIDILITDCEMPEMNGGDLCRIIRTELKMPDIPVIFLTGISDRSNLVSLFKDGATDYLIKPYLKEEFVARLSVHLERSMLTVSLREKLDSLEKANEQIKIMSITDTLTGCYNRSYMNTQLAQEINRHLRYENPLSLIICDIDHFKKINDTYGHQAGDKILAEFVKRIKDTYRHDLDWCARYGGEEFVVVLPETEPEHAAHYAERLRAHIAETPFANGNQGIAVTASFGVAGIDDTYDDTLSMAKLIKQADSMLYKAKESGRNRVETGK